MQKQLKNNSFGESAKAAGNSAAKKSSEKESLYELLKDGLEDCLAHARGELALKTTVLPGPPPRATPKSIVALRKDLEMSQSAFAATLNVSTRTVQSWEQGARVPSDASLRLLQIIRSEPSVVETVILGGQPHISTRRLAAK